MKIMLTVAGSAVLFHVTSKTNAFSILRDGYFHLKPTEGTEAEESLSGATYYLSTARSPTSRYIWGLSSTDYESKVALFELDGQLLGQRYKITPVDYWKQGAAGREAEDRLISPKPKIPLTGILALHVTMNFDAQELKRLCLKRKVKVYFYSNSRDALLRSKSKRIDVPLQKIGVKKQEPVGEYQRSVALRKATEPFYDTNDLYAWNVLYKAPVSAYDQLPDKSRKIVYNLRYNPLAQSKRRIEVDMHNAKSGSAFQRRNLEKLVTLLRAKRWTVDDFIEALRAKWYPAKDTK